MIKGKVHVAEWVKEGMMMGEHVGDS